MLPLRLPLGRRRSSRRKAFIPRGAHDAGARGPRERGDISDIRVDGQGAQPELPRGSEQGILMVIEAANHRESRPL